MAAFNKFNIFTKDLLNGVHNFGSNTFKVMLTNTAPTAANAVKADLTDITAGNGYTAGGSASAMTVSTATGTAKATTRRRAPRSPWSATLIMGPRSP